MRYKKIEFKSLQFGQYCSVKLNNKYFPAIITGYNCREDEYAATVFYKTQKKIIQGEYIIKGVYQLSSERHSIYTPIKNFYYSFFRMSYNPYASGAYIEGVSKSKKLKDVLSVFPYIWKIFNLVLGKNIISTSKWDTSKVAICEGVGISFDYMGNGRVFFKTPIFTNTISLPHLIDRRAFCAKNIGILPRGVPSWKSMVRRKLDSVKKYIEKFFDIIHCDLPNDINAPVYKFYDFRAPEKPIQIFSECDIYFNKNLIHKRYVSLRHALLYMSLKQVIQKKILSEQSYPIEIHYYRIDNRIGHDLENSIDSLSHILECWSFEKQSWHNYWKTIHKMLDPSLDDLLCV